MLSNVLVRRTFRKSDVLFSDTPDIAGEHLAERAFASTNVFPLTIEDMECALELENIEYAFYRGGLKRFSGLRDFDFLIQYSEHPAILSLVSSGLLDEGQDMTTWTATVKTPDQTMVGDNHNGVKTVEGLVDNDTMVSGDSLARLTKPEFRVTDATIATVEAIPE